MRIQIQCFGAMRDYLPEGSDGRNAMIDLPDDGRVGDAVAALGAPGGLVHAILVNDEPARLDTNLNDGDRLTLMPHYSGGAGGCDG